MRHSSSLPHVSRKSCPPFDISCHVFQGKLPTCLHFLPRVSRKSWTPVSISCYICQGKVAHLSPFLVTCVKEKLTTCCHFWSRVSRKSCTPVAISYPGLTPVRRLWSSLVESAPSESAPRHGSKQEITYRYFKLKLNNNKKRSLQLHMYQK